MDDESNQPGGSASRDDIPPDRQAELRAAYERNLAAGAAPYANVHIRSRVELQWVLAERGWDTHKDTYLVRNVLLPQGITVERANLRGVMLGQVDLAGVALRRADLRHANLVRTNLASADLVDADLVDAQLSFANLHDANLHSANLAGAHLHQANLSGAILRYTDLCGARCYQADLTSADLVGAHLDASTVLAQAHFDGRTQLRDVMWGGAALSRVAWERLPRLGDEVALRQRRTVDGKPKRRARRLAEYQGAYRAYQQLTVALRGQGLDDDAARYAFRAQILRRKALWLDRAPGRWLLSWLLAALAGYGYRLQRILITYALVIAAFAVTYYVIGLPNEHAPTILQQVADAFQVSLTALHGRTFFEQFGIGSTLAWIAAIESVCGIVIEGVFVAMLVQRFFGGK